MRKLTVIYPLLFCLSFMMSCEEGIESSSRYDEQELVLNSIFSNKNQWHVNVSTTQNIFSDNPMPRYVDDAQVSIIALNDNTGLELINERDGNYSSAGMKPRWGVNYKISVFHPNYKILSAEATLPFPLESISLDTSTIFVDEVRAIKFDLAFDDVDPEENFYVWDIISSNVKGNATSSGGVGIDIKGTSVNGSLFGDKENFTAVVSDEISQSQLFSTDRSVNEKGVVENSFYSLHDGYFRDDEETQVIYYVRLRTVSEDLYNYLQSVEMYRLRGDINSSETTPSELFSNVINGRGIFAGYSETIIQL